MAKTKPRRKISSLMVFTGLTILCWIGFQVYQALKQPTISLVLKEQIKPLDPSFDKKTLESLKERRFITQEEIGSVPEITEFESEKEEEIEASPAAEIIIAEEGEIEGGVEGE
jgi:hypothetical protein